MKKFRYIIMCGGNYKHWETPRQLSLINGEEVVARTIRLLRENGIDDIAISSNNPVFEKFGVPVLQHDNLYIAQGFKIEQGDWFNAFYPTNEPTCYLFGDVVFSDEAIKTIVETETDDIEFFGSRPPFADNYIKTHEEPFALKVADTNHLKKAIAKTRELNEQGKFWRKPIMWELWTVIKDAPLQKTKGEFPAEYIVINDYTCDVDWKEDVIKMNLLLGGDKDMVKVEVLEDFTLRDFNSLKNIVRKNKNKHGHLYKGDVFECDHEMAKYLTGGNKIKKVVIKILEVIPTQPKVTIEKIVESAKDDEEIITPIEEVKVEKPKRTRKKKNEN